ncbi:MAG TPA: molybdopterin-synthase adenylyltransferase MoeB [Acidimicrobiia bacterium]|jgi:molybdopterin/thiamine biosynthesis adenylyltransferase/rhodanese-related sulfurtransferase|nr:molybdopterin-synthase adenylyltransferase MoeB [Acidimicrobiia bacterium]
MVKRYRDLVAAAKATITEISPQPAWKQAQDGAVIVDIREPGEYATGVIPGAVLVPRGVLESDIPRHVPDAATEVLLVCAAGNRSALAAATLEAMGYENVASVAGGMSAWKAQQLPWGGPAGLTPEQRIRYARHLILPEVGEAGQERLLAARAVLIGAGGLGSPASLYLAAAGVGTLVLIDDDVVDPSNLQRQVIHTTERVGRPKVESAMETLEAINPDVTIERHRTRLTSHNVLDLFDGADVVIDGTDNFPTRYLVNDASLRVRVPVVHASVLRFEGQASVFEPYAGPCYRCLYPQPPPVELAPNCAEAGVLGVLPGVMGTIQAVEALKIILDIGDRLSGRLLTFDALDGSFLSFRIERNPACPACADESSPPRLVDYDEQCIAVVR